MKKKDLMKIRKSFKVDGNSIQIHSIYNFIYKANECKPLTQGPQYFECLDENLREKYILSFKKILTGNFDTNLFNLNFNKDPENTTQNELLELKNSDLEEEKVLKFIKNIKENKVYGYADKLISILTATIIVQTKEQKKKNEEDDDFQGYEYDVMMYMVSSLEEQTSSFVLNKSTNEINLNKNIELMKIGNPEEGFTFPAYNDGFVDVNNVLYYTKKKDEPNEIFINKVLNCNRNITSKAQKEVFSNIIKVAVGEEVDTETLSNLYSEIRNAGESSGSVDTNVLTKLLVNNGLGEEGKIKNVIKKTLKRKEAELNIDNIIHSKQIELKNSSITVKIDADKLNTVVKTKNNGKSVLMIELDDNLNIDDLKLGNKVF